MIVHFKHPVMAEARDTRSGETRYAYGTTVTDIELAEFERDETTVAFEVPSGNIVEAGGRLWRLSSISHTRFSDLGFTALVGYVNDDVSPTFDEIALRFNEMACKRPGEMLPRPPRGYAFGPMGQMGAMSLYGRVGDISTRRVTDIDEEQVEGWRQRMRDTLAAFAVIGGKTFELCHEPLLAVDGHSIMLSNASVLRRYANRLDLDARGFPVTGQTGRRPTMHVFPADAGDEAVEFADTVSGKPGGGVAHFFKLEVHGNRSSSEDIIERETCRFAGLHLEHVAGAAARYREDGSRSAALDDYIASGERLLEAARGWMAGSTDHEDLVAALEHTAETGAGLDMLFMSAMDAGDWTRLNAHTALHLVRTDTLPVSIRLPVSPKR